MKAILTTILIALTNHAIAQAPAPSAQPAGKPQEQTQQKESGMRFGVIYSMADTIVSSGKAGSQSFSETDKGSGALGLLLENKIKLENEKTFVVGFSYELSRSFTTYSGAVGSTSLSGTYSSKPTLNVGNLYGNYGIKINNESEFYLGLGYSMLTMGNSTFTAKGTLGYQFGFNYEFNKNKYFMAEYRFIRGTGDATISGTAVTIDSATFDGLLLGVKFGI